MNNRRIIMTIVGLMGAAFGFSQSDEAEEIPGDNKTSSKVLVVTYSYTGNTRFV